MLATCVVDSDRCSIGDKKLIKLLVDLPCGQFARLFLLIASPSTILTGVRIVGVVAILRLLIVETLRRRCDVHGDRLTLTCKHDLPFDLVFYSSEIPIEIFLSRFFGNDNLIHLSCQRTVSA